MRKKIFIIIIIFLFQITVVALEIENEAAKITNIKKKNILGIQCVLKKLAKSPEIVLLPPILAIAITIAIGNV